MVADRVRQRLGEADRTALIALAGVVCSLGVWALWAWVGTYYSDATFAQSLLLPESSVAVMRLAAVVVVACAVNVSPLMMTVAAARTVPSVSVWE